MRACFDDRAVNPLSPCEELRVLGLFVDEPCELLLVLALGFEEPSDMDIKALLALDTSIDSTTNDFLKLHKHLIKGTNGNSRFWNLSGFIPA